MKLWIIARRCIVVLSFALISCSGGSDSSTNSSTSGNDNVQSQGEGIIGADGIIGHPPAELIGTWTFRSVTVDQMPSDLASYLDFTAGAVDARLHIMTNSAYLYEEVDFRGGQLWAEWGFIYFNEGDFDVNQQFNTAGPEDQFTVFDYTLQDGVLFLSENTNGEIVVLVLTM